MADAISGKLQLWEGWMTPVGPPWEARGLSGPHNASEFADRLYVGEALFPDPRAELTTQNAEPGAAKPGVPHTEFRAPSSGEPFSLQWFLDVENARHSKHARWIPKLLEFAKHRGERLLGLGNGLGTDWVQYARHGADVVVCSPSAEQLALIHRNFQLRDLRGLFLHSDPTNLPLEAASIDVVCVNGLLQELADPRSVVEEVYRVLKPGGKVLAATPGRYDVHFWCRDWLPWRRWRARTQQAVLIRYSGRRLRRLFDRFVEHRVYKRHLRRSETPYLFRCVPMPLLERLLGHMLVLKAFKPLSAAISVQQAA
jgi:SAM-dependent methyltransferase